jgi:predicted small integral membrane protein
MRLCKIAVVACSFLYLLAVVYNNLSDYNSNYQFVRHVLGMDTTLPGNAGMWRAIQAPWMHRAFYAAIILWESASAALIGIGACRLWAARRAPAAEWQGAKTLAAAGLTAGMALWYLAFITVGGEWFLMWQSKVWNGLESAFREFTVMGISLVFLSLRDD